MDELEAPVFGSVRSGCCKNKNRSKMHKYSYTFCIYFAFTVLGWVRGLFGPSFLDLQLISGADLEQGSWIATTFFIGYAVGSLAGGILYKKINQKLLFGACLLVLANMVAATPWCFLYWAMVTVHFMQGVTQGVVDTAGNAEILQLWKENRMVYFGLDLLFGVGSFISPLVAAPFLIDIPKRNETVLQPNTSLIAMKNLSEVTYKVDNRTANKSTNTIYGTETKSVLYVPYSITAGLLLLVSFSFFLQYRLCDMKINLSNQARDKEKQSRKLPNRTKICSLAVISAIFLMFTSFNEAFSSYLTVYCVAQLSWSTSEGAVITSVVNIVGIVSTVIALFLKRLDSVLFSGIHCICLVISTLGILLSSIYYNVVGIWISVLVLGYFKAVLFSLLYTWTNEKLTPVSGKISSLFMISSMIGSSVNPIFLGYLMEEFTSLWFCYLFLIESSLTLILYIVAVVITNYIVSKYGKTYPHTPQENNTQDISGGFIQD